MNNAVCSDQRGSMLIMALWVLLFLTVLVVQIGFGVRTRIDLVKRIEDRADVSALASAGAQTAISFLSEHLDRYQDVFDLKVKMDRFNQPQLFRSIDLNGGHAFVGYRPYDRRYNIDDWRYGIVDEERKININSADKMTLLRLVSRIFVLNKDEASELVDAIVDWREFDSHELEGFFSDGYYGGLVYPYPPRNLPFEYTRELLLVKGVTQDVFDRIEPFVTVYGDGRVNINTAPIEVLFALGLNDEVAGKVVDVRNGEDGIESTSDDHIFERIYDVSSEVRSQVKLEPNEVKQIDMLNIHQLIKLRSDYYSIHSFAELNGQSRQVVALFNGLTHTVDFWMEK